MLKLAHALEGEHACMVLLDEAETGLRELLSGKRVSADDLMSALRINDAEGDDEAAP